MGTLVWLDNFDGYTANAALPSPWSVASNNQVKTTTVHSSPNAVAIGVAGNGGTCSRAFGSSLATWYADFWYNCPSVGGSAVGVGLSWSNSGGGNGVQFRCTGSTGVSTLQIPGQLTTMPGFTLSTDAYHHLLVEVFADASAGTLKLTVDGAVIGNVTGDTRANGATATTYNQASITGVTIGPSPAAEGYVDDLAIYSGAVARGAPMISLIA